MSDAFHIGGTRGQPAIFSVSQPDEDDFRSFLLCFRHLVAKKEPATLDRIANLLLANLHSDALRTFLSDSRETWRRGRRGVIELIIDGRDYGPEWALDLYLNGRYFHTNEAKASELASVGDMGRRLTRQQLNAMLVAGVNYASELEWAILTGRRDGLLHC